MNTLDAAAVPLRGRHLIEASAGTGKTFTITTLCLRLVVEQGLEPEEILVVTYTRAATAELRDRVRTRLRQALAYLEADPGDRPDDAVLATLVGGWDAALARDRLARALAGFDLAPISTIHSFCQRALRENAFESATAFDLDLADDRGKRVEEIARDLWTELTWQQHPMFLQWLRSHTPTVDLAQAQRFVSAGLAAAKVRVLPVDTGEVPDLEGIGDRVTQAHHAARKVWFDTKREVCQAIDTCAALPANRYKPGKTVDNAATVEAALQQRHGPFGVKGLDDALAYFDPAVLAERRKTTAIRDGIPAPSHPTMQVLAKLREALAAAEAVFVAERVRLCRALVEQAEAVRARTEPPDADARFFDDLLVDLADALSGPGGPRLAAALRRRLGAALIDEFQDTDPVQWRIFSRLFPDDDGTLFVIGDPKQAIYGFRGADLNAYLAARETIPEAHHWRLDVNWRSDAPLVSAVNHLFAQGADPFTDTRIPFVEVKAAHAEPRLLDDGQPVAPLQLQLFPPRGGGGAWGNYADHNRIPDVVGDEIVGLLDSATTLPDGDGRRPLRPGDIAILVSTHREAAGVQDALAQRRVPSVRYGQTRVYASDDGYALQVLLEAVAHPHDVRRVRAALVGPYLGWTADDLVAMAADDATEQAELDRFRGWRDTWVRRGFMRWFQQFLREADVMGRLLPQLGGERRLTNLRHLAELCHAAEQERGVGPLGLLAWLAEERAEERASGLDDAALMRLESDARAVQIVTMHTSKGLQYPVVFCPYLWKWVNDPSFPTFHDDEGHLALQLHPEAHPDDAAQAQLEARAERIRLAYVALTRAEHLCVVATGRLGGPGWNYATGALTHLLFPPEGAPWSHLDKIKKMSPREFEEKLQALAGSSGGGIVVRDAVDVGPSTWRPPAAPAVVHLPRQPRGGHGADQRISSFSGLVRRAHDAAYDRDTDGHAPMPPAPAPDPGDAPPLTLAPWPRGPAPGTAYHAAFEDLDFAEAAAGGDAARAHVVEQLSRRGFDDDDAVEAVVRSVSEVVRTPLGGDAPMLAQIDPDWRIDELGFTMRAGRGAKRLTPARLAAAFAEHGPPRLRAAVADHIASLAFDEVEGALTGFVDLSFAHDGRWWVVDYKTNHLGDHLDAYAPERLDDAMIHGDYVLQYHLYVLALHRWLRRRVKGWTYDTHMGGVRYLFVRGMHPDAGPDRGVFADRPSAAMIDALDAVLGEAP